MLTTTSAPAFTARTAVLSPPDPEDHINGGSWIYTVFEETWTVGTIPGEAYIKNVRSAAEGTVPGGESLHHADAQQAATAMLRDAGWVQVGSWEPGWRQVNGLTKELSGGFEAVVIPA